MRLSIILTLTKGNFFSDVIQSFNPVLVYFWAPWCGPCSVITPVLEQLADEYGGRVKIGRVNIDEQPALTAEYGIRAVPTLVSLRAGRVTDRLIGFRTRRELEESFEQVMA
jgi:thioredoxin 1